MTGKEADKIFDLVGQRQRIDMHLTKLKEDIENDRYDKNDHYGCPASVPQTALEGELDRITEDIDDFKIKP